MGCLWKEADVVRKEKKEVEEKIWGSLILEMLQFSCLRRIMITVSCGLLSALSLYSGYFKWPKTIPKECIFFFHFSNSYYYYEADCLSHVSAALIKLQILPEYFFSWPRDIVASHSITI